MEDWSTVPHERIGPTNGALILWIAVAPPTALVASTDATGDPVNDPAEGINLTWNSNGNSGDGGYLLQRRERNGTHWASVVSLPATLPLTHRDTAVLPGQLYHYRVRATFGTSVSAPSNEAQAAAAGGVVTGFMAEDSDHDSVSNFDELSAGTDPYNPDSDLDGFWDGVDYAPLNPNVQLPPHNPEDHTALTLHISRP